MPKPLTAPARLHLLLPWLNGDLDEHVLRLSNRPEDTETFTDPLLVRRAIADFVQSFDGSPGAGHLEVTEDATPAHVRHLTDEPTDEELEDLRVWLQILLAQGFGDGTMGDLSDSMFPAGSLTFAVRNAGRQKPGRRDSVGGTRGIVGGVTALRTYQAAGAYVLQVRGATRELVTFLVAHLLTAPGMVAVRRCQRPGCEHFVVTATAARGRPREFCSGSCGKRNAEQIELQRKQRRRK